MNQEELILAYEALMSQYLADGNTSLAANRLLDGWQFLQKNPAVPFERFFEIFYYQSQDCEECQSIGIRLQGVYAR